MGLDMYLNAKRFLWHNESELAEKISANFPELGETRIKSITAEVGYWRKANAIHKWFVDNVQDGVDDCGNYEVSFDKLQELVDLIDKVLADRNLAPALLPSSSGFFFGNTEYDDWYFSDLESSKTMLEDLISRKESLKGWWLEYHSSW